MSKLLRTALHGFNANQGAKFVPFAGFEMPVQYRATGPAAEHHATRNGAALFDVSHMGQLRITGKDRVAFLEKLTPVALAGAKNGQAKLSVIMNNKGGIVDDTVMTKHDGYIYQVINAACVDKDLKYFAEKKAEFGYDVNIDHQKELGLIALQGPKAAEILQGLLGESVDLSKVAFMTGFTGKVKELGGLEMYITRCGYTGEDGFEISTKPEDAPKLAELLISKGVVPAGLGARDSLRLEAGLCLYGHDMDDNINPIEAGLGFLISKKRREEGGFIGDSFVQAAVKDGVPKKRVGLLINHKMPAREGAEIIDVGGQVVGKVTSGGPSPTLKKNIAMGYVPTHLSKNGTKLKVRPASGKTELEAEVTKMPFVETHYYRVPETKQ